MEKTYIDYFNFYLKQCLNEIISYFPYTKKMILENYRALLEGNDEKNDLYVKYFMTKANNHLLQIAKKDETLFIQNQHICLLEGVNFHQLWNSSDATFENKLAVWKYLQLLVLIGRRCIPNKSEIVSMLEKVGGTVEAPDPLDKTLEKAEKEEETEKGGLGNLLQGLGNLTKLGKGLGGEGKDGGLDLGGIMKMAQSLAESLKDIDLSKLEDQFNQENNEESGNEDGQIDVENTDSENNLGSKQENNPVNNLLENSLFGDLANEMANTFNFDDLEAESEDGKPDLSKTLNNFMSGDNPAKFMISN